MPNYVHTRFKFKMEKSLVISHDWQGNVPASLSPTKNSLYVLNFRVSPISGDLIIEVDAPFYDDPPPIERPQMQCLTPHSPEPSTSSLFPFSPKSGRFQFLFLYLCFFLCVFQT